MRADPPTAGRTAAIDRLLLACGPLGSVFFTTVYLIEGALHPGYSLIREPISSLELVAHGWTQRANFIIFGVLILCFAVGIRRVLAGGIGATWFPILQALVAVGLLISGVFVRDPLHTIGDFVSFLAMLAGFVVIARRFAAEPRWRGWAAYSLVSAVAILALLAAFGYAQGHGGPAGLLERLAVLVRSVWSLLFVGRLLLAGADFGPTAPAARTPAAPIGSNGGEHG